MTYSGPIIDIHAHIAFTPDEQATENHGIGADALRAGVGLDRVEHSTAIVMARAGEPEATTRRNDQVLAAAEATAGFIIPVVSVHPHDGEAALAELDRAAAKGARMLKLHPNTQAFDVADERVAAVVGRAGDHGIVTLFDGWNPFDGDQPGKFLKLAMAHQHSHFIVAHFGGLDFAKLMVFEIAARYPFWKHNVHFDVSAIAELLAGSPYAEQFVWVMRKVGVDKILYGSDWPVCDPKASLDAVLALGLTQDEEKAILHDNAKALLGL
ncbi:amidohydrolase family protein [Phytomonospora sp. NPDC050363]|uniref:amidohydrolase family protein n=1 Tax=Phytomonospora sp. NPDC050363 TaxID=3155642 RepID=UPI00340CA8C4